MDQHGPQHSKQVAYSPFQDNRMFQAEQAVLSDIDQAFAAAAADIEGVRRLAESLHERLSRVLCPAVPATAQMAVPKDREPQTDLAQRLSSLGREARVTSDLLRDILDRLGL